MIFIMSTVKRPISCLKIVKSAIEETIKKELGIEENKVPLLPFVKSAMWDFQSAFPNKIYSSICKSNPATKERFPSVKDMARDLGQIILRDYPTLFEKVEVSEQGFVLFLLHSEFLLTQAQSYIFYGAEQEVTKDPLTIAVDFSSPNIAKEMHVGHLRSTILGESICRFFEYKGHEVFRINHLGDWGTQFGMLIAYLFEKFPNFIQMTPKLSDLESFYRESKVRFDQDPEFKKKAQQKVVELQSGDELCLKAWKTLCGISETFYQQIYDKLSVKIENFGESHYNSMLPAIVNELREKGLLKEDGGAQCVFIPGIKIPVMVVKSDGGYNYDSTDLAALKHRVVNLKANRLIYITDVGQFNHFKGIFEVGKMANWVTPSIRLDHMGFGVILGENGERMKTRGGDTIKLMDLIEESKERAKKQLLEREKETEEKGSNFKQTHLSSSEIDNAAEILGIAAIKYFDLKQNRIQNYKFDFDQMLSQKGDTAVYLLYSYIRLCSIVKKTKMTEDEMRDISDFSFTDDFEKVLVRQLIKFPDVIDTVLDELNINKLCDYLYSLSVKIAEAYHTYKIIGNENTRSRVKLIFACKKIMEKCFHLLSIETIDKI